MVKQVPRDRPLRGKQLPGGYNAEGEGPGLVETNVMYLNAHAEEWKPPTGDLHLHLMCVNSRVRWQVAELGSLVCKVPGRCHLVTVRKRGARPALPVD
ncbi:hypothetical protein LCGC14_3135680 [marine sediment metagenome]|uniref:Uncharacterized protein n=1 Tax=marine sediment metagenome TaxID=412755 RepID=A0A0F8YMT7_9ZZZZ